jgi:hypothetical protein
MRFEGRIEKHGDLWLAEVPAFDALTQGRTRREALEMVEDLLETMANSPGFRATVYSRGRDETFEVGGNRLGVLLALLLRRQRERQGITLAEAARRLGQTSHNAYARYEQGKAMPTVEKLEQLLKAIAPDQEIVWRIAA